jgi:hypothetical protein
VEAKGGTITTLSRIPIYYTFRFKGVLQGHHVTSFIDGGVTHNINYATLVVGRCISIEDFEGFNVVVVDGCNMTCA